MPEPDKSSRSTSRRTDPRNTIILLLGIAVAILLGVVFRDHLPGLFRAAPAPPAGEPVGVLDVVLDREQLRYLDVVFDRPLGEDRVGDVMGRDPVVVSPPAGGSWRWQSPAVLRLEPAGRFSPAMEYRLQLVPERLLRPGQVFTGETALSIRTDQFQVERVDIYEEAAPAGAAGVVVRGDVRFNYPVDPKALAAKMQLVDPLRGGSSPVALSVEAYYPERIVSFRSEPILKQRAARELKLIILSDLTPAQGNVPLPADHVQPIPLGSSEVLTLRSLDAVAGDPESTVRLVFSSPVDAESAARYVTIAPPAEHRMWSTRNELALAGALTPGTEYELRLAPGLPGEDGSLLQEAVIRSVRIPDIDPDVDFQSPGMFLSASGYRHVGVQSVNVEEIALEVARVYRNNLFLLFSYHDYEVWNDRSWGFPGHRLGDVLATETIRPGGARNKRTATPLGLDRWVSGHEPGLYRIGLGRPGSGENRQRWILITDLGVVAKVGRDECTVWVASFADLSPIAGAQVRLISSQNQTMAGGVTDASGRWRARELGGVEEGPRPWMVTIERGNDFSFLLLDRAGIDTAGLDVGGARQPKAGYEAFAYGERDIFRPGEVAEGLIVVRDRGLQPPPVMPLLLRHKDPLGQERGTVRLTLERGGTAPFRHEIPTYARTGRHTLEVLVAEEVIGQYRFQVEEFIPDRIKVEIAAARQEVVAGEALSYRVSGAYLFGPHASGLPVESRVRLAAAPFQPDGFPGMTFGDPERPFEPREIAAFEGQSLDGSGVRSFEAQVPAGLRPPASLEATVTARVQEQGGRGVSAVQRLRVHPYPRYLGLRREGETSPEPGRPVAFAWVAVGPDGRETPSGALRASFFLDRWQTVLRRTPEGNFRYESVRDPQLLETRPVGPGGTKGSLSFTPRAFGSYRAVLSDPEGGASTQVEFYASGWGYSAWAIKDPGRIEMDLDQTEYLPGETAIVRVRAPFSGKLFVTVERDRVLDSQVHDLTGNTARLSIPIRAEYRPNVYVTAVLVRPVKDLEPGGAGRAFGAVPLDVDRTAHRLPITVEAPDQVRPRSKLAVQVSVQPGSTLTVAAVDEGILQLIGQKTPDPFSWFYRKLGLDVRAYDIFAQLLPEVPPAHRRSGAGGDAAMEGLAQFVRTDAIRRVEPVAFWSGSVHPGPDGRASVTFDLPEFQGALRLMAVAHRADRFGSAERTIRVRSPLVVLPTFPRALSFGETARVPVTVRNDTGGAGPFEVRLEAVGPVRVQGEASRRVDVPRGGEKTVIFTVVTADREGEVRFTATASGEGESSSSTQALVARPDLPSVGVDAAGAVEQAEATLPGVEAARFRPGTVRRELRISPLPMARFSARLEELLRYPYGCLEQTVSSAFPLLYFGDLAKEWDPQTFRTAEPSALVQEGIRRLGAMQVQGGGFGLWPGSDELHPWGSVYATHFLVEARRAGHHVETWLHDRALGFTAAEPKARSTYAFDELQRAAYALWVLARAGRPDRGTMDFIRERHSGELKGETRALLGAAYAAAGDSRTSAELLVGLEEIQARPRETGGNLNSPIRNRALLLLALLDAAPSDPRVAEIAQRLSREAGELSWWSTQETAFVFLSLGQVHRRQAARAPYSGAAFAGDRPLGKFGPRTAVFGGIEGTQPIRLRMDAGYEPGAAFFALQTRGVPTDEAFRPESSGLEIVRTYHDRSGAPLGAAVVKQGDLIVVKAQVRSTSGPLDNVVVVNLLPSGLEVENPRLKSAESLPWIVDAGPDPDFLDIRDDRVLTFLDLRSDAWHNTYALLRAVTSGSFRLPPAQAEAMYDASRRATTDRGALVIETPP